FAVIQDLVLEADGRSFVAFALCDKIFYPAVGTFAHFELKLQIKGAEHFLCDNIPSVLRLRSVGGEHAEGTIANLPAFGRKTRLIGTAPATRGLTIPKQSYAVVFFLIRQRVRDAVDHKDVIRR